MDIQFNALTTDIVYALQNGGLDANGQQPERHTADGSGQPCRHCLDDIDAGISYLILAFRPFPDLQPYAELGPIFLHADHCSRFAGRHDLPNVLLNRQTALIKGYSADNRIRYGTGRIVETMAIAEHASAIFADPEVAYIHARSAQNNCYFCRIDRVVHT